jgi:hypothetical protein
MLHNRDFLLRLIEQLGQALARMLDKILARSPEQMAELGEELDGIAYRAGLDLVLARRLAPETLHIMVAPAGTLDPSRCWLLAELLFLDGLQSERRAAAAAARESFERSLHLYQMVRPEWKAEIPLPDAADRVAELEARLAALAPQAGG